MKHKHYDLIVTKAANIKVIKFVKLPQGWVATQTDEWNETSDYFLCLPQHKEACLHWLNGGESQLEYTHQSYPTWNSIDNDAKDWSTGHVFMDGSLSIRIKPKKEKRWIVWNENQDSYHCTFLVDPSDRYEANFKFSIHEIEVEV